MSNPFSSRRPTVRTFSGEAEDGRPPTESISAFRIISWRFFNAGRVRMASRAASPAANAVSDRL